MKLKSVQLSRLMSTFVFVFAVIAAQFSGVSFVHAVVASTDTWTGTAGDNKFSTAANWDTNAVPVNGDVLAFPALTGGGLKTLNNDLSSLVLGGLTIGQTTFDSTNWVSYTIDSIHFGDGAIISQKTSADMQISGSIVADGSLVFDGSSSPLSASTADINVPVTNLTVQNAPMKCMGGGGGNFAVNWKPSGTVTVATGGNYFIQPTNSPSSVIVGSGALLGFWSATTAPITYAGDVTFNGGGTTQGSPCGQPNLDSLESSASSVTLSGTITLNGGDILYTIADGTTLTVTGPISGGTSALKKSTTSTGTFVNNSSANNSATLGGTQAVPVTTLPAVTDNLVTTDMYVLSKTIVSLDGTRQYVNVNSSATLMGTGTAQTLSVQSGCTIAPGHSPGKFTVTQTLNLYAGSTYQAQLKNATAGGYDQIQVSDPSRTTGNDVNIDPAAILDTSLYSGYSINKGDQFTIINNLQPSTQKVLGTFAGLAEGAQLTVSGITFSISYVGGDGNDVVLTALNTGKDPSTPNTGAQPLKLANPIVLVGLGMTAASLLFVAARRRFNN